MYQVIHKKKPTITTATIPGCTLLGLLLGLLFMKNSSINNVVDHNIVKLPFKGNKPDLKSVTVSDGFGLSLDVPSRGYASIEEYNAVMELFARYANPDGGLNTNRVKSFELDLVNLMLKSRFKSTSSNLCLTDDGEDVGAPMLKALFEFFSKELGLKLDLPLGHFNSNLEEAEL